MSERPSFSDAHPSLSCTRRRITSIRELPSNYMTYYDVRFGPSILLHHLATILPQLIYVYQTGITKRRLNRHALLRIQVLYSFCSAKALRPTVQSSWTLQKRLTVYIGQLLTKCFKISALAPAIGSCKDFLLRLARERPCQRCRK